MISLIIYIGTSLLLLFLPGFAILKRIQWLKGDFSRLAFSPILGVMLAAFLEILVYKSLIGRWVLIFVSALIIGISFFQVWQQRHEIHFSTTDRKAILVFFTIVLLTSIYVTLPMSKQSGFLPDPEYIAGSNYSAFNVKILNLAHTQANDNFIPYRQAQFFVNKISIHKNPYLQPEWGVNFFFRTPLMGLITAYQFELNNVHLPADYPWRIAYDSQNTYFKFQILAHILNYLFILPAFVLFRFMFSRRVALLSITLISLNAFFMYNSYFSWPKSFVAYFILSAIVLILVFRKYFIAGVIIGVAYWAHDLAILYAAGLSYVVLFSHKNRLRNLFELLLPAFIAIAPWYIVSRIIYKQTSLFIYYPISIRGIPSDTETSHLLKEFISTPILRILSIKVESFVFLFTPYQFIFEKNDFFTGLWGVTIFSVPGALGLSLVPFSLFGLWKRFHKDIHIIIGMLIVPLLLAIFIIGWPKGLGAMHFAEPTVVILIGYATHILFKQRTWIIAIVTTLLLAQSSLLLLNSYGFALSSWLHSNRSIAKLLVYILLTGVLLLILGSTVSRRRNV